MDPWVAEAICKAVYAAARDGSGDLRMPRRDNPNRVSIHVNGAVAYADRDDETHTLTVIRIVTKG